MVERDMRQEFLIKMYNQTWNNINRHINVIWQPIGLLIASLGLLSLGEKNIINFDIAVALIILFCGWFIAHVYDSAHWYNRNLIILSNIEKQFLTKKDEKEIHYFFSRPFPEKEPMITHFKLQKLLGYGIILLVIVFHMLNRITFVSIDNANILITVQYWLPYLTILAVFVYLDYHIKKLHKKYNELIEKSPGKIIQE